MRHAVGTILTLVALSIVGCGGDDRVDLQIYDSNNEVDTRLDIDDVVASSARSTRESDGSAVLYFELTDQGAVKFAELTRALARRGASLNRSQAFVFEVDDHIYARPVVDHQAFPDGLDGDAGLQIGGFRPEVAARLATEIRDT